MPTPLDLDFSDGTTTPDVDEEYVYKSPSKMTSPEKRKFS